MVIFKNRIVYILLITIFFSGNIFSQDNGQKFTLEQLLDNAIQNNYLLQASHVNTSIKKAEIEKIKTQYQPEINTFASFSYWKFLMPNKERLLGGTLSDFYTEIAVEQTVYDWGVKDKETARVEEEIKLNDEIRRQLKHTIIWGVTDAYFEALKAKVEIAVQQNTLNQLEEQMKYSQNLYDIGKVSGVDILKVKVETSVANKALNKAENQLREQLSRLKRLCYLGSNSEFAIEDATEELYGQKAGENFSLAVIYQQAIQNHPVLMSRQHELNIESRERDLYRLENRPDFFTYGVASWEHGYIPFGDNFNYNIGVGIRYTLPFGKGSRHKSDILQSKLRMEQIEHENSQTLEDIKKEIDVAVNNINQLETEISDNRQIIEIARETLDNAQVKYRGGQGNIIDVLDAQTILTNARIDHQKSVAGYLQVLAKLHYLAGNDGYPF